MNTAPLPPPIDSEYLQDMLLKLLRIHSPTGYTDPIVRVVCRELERLGVDFELTRRGAIRADFSGEIDTPDRAIVSHLDTLGAMVQSLKPNGRLGIVPIGTWSSRFAEGARVSVFTDDHIFRGTILPLKASGHVYDREVDEQPVSWDNLEVRVDEAVHSLEDLQRYNLQVGDFIGVDAAPEVLANGYINSRHLDNKAGVAAMLAAIKAIHDGQLHLPVSCHMLFTISEEVGSGASAVLHGDVAEMVSIDNGTVAPGQASTEHGLTVAMADSSGPFDFHLTHHLLNLASGHGIPTVRDVFKHYRCDSASAVEAGNDIRTALMTFGVDASHGYERTHMDALRAIAATTVLYACSEPYEEMQRNLLPSLESFPETREQAIGPGEAGKDLPRVEPPAPEEDRPEPGA
ncbi:MAG: osmoprotectant NAGGN system M42 family peptidase [Opitutales bacterium]